MPEHIGNIFEAGAVAHHVRSDGVRKDVGAGTVGVDACGSQRALGQLRHRFGSGQWITRGAVIQRNRAMRTGGLSFFDVRDERAADFGQQGQNAFAELYRLPYR